MDEPRQNNGVIAWLAGAVSVLLLLVCLIALAGWIGGDVHEWSKWLSWVPAVLLLPVGVIGLLSATVVHGPFGAVLRTLQFVLVLFLASVTIGSDWGMFRARATTNADLVLVHWNASWPDEQTDLEEVYTAIRAADPDLVIITEPGQFGWGGQGQAFMANWPHVTRSAGIVVLSRTRLSEVRPILAADGIDLVYVQMPFDGIDLPIWVLDLPSDPARARGPIFQRVLAAARSRKLHEPDLVIGDLNVPLHSQALDAAFPNLKSAFDEAGSGWSGTWPRQWPFWQLDQLLVGPRVRCLRYEVIDPGVGRHRMQRAVIRKATRPEETPAPSSA